MNTDFRKPILNYYNRAAHIYDLIEFIRRNTRPKVVEKSNLKQGEKVLDACTGTGDLALAFAKAGAEVTGIDIAENMLLRAREKTNGFHVTWIKMDASNIKFRDNFFDISTISLALHHMPEEEQSKVLTELARVTRRKIIIVEPHQPFNRKLHWLWGVVGSIVDESKFMPQWVRQDFNRTCNKAGLLVEDIEVTTRAIHRITVCKPI
jgi:demethylmenaquinone methyltransferase/2-methoxy-6-polyprenyl-1,4-benzoquinol methylase